jgi:pSer/pThr/pTyr-binding forkhead associated (FHA) protein
VVTASRPHYNAMIAAGGPDAGEIQFPSHCPERRFSLSGPQMRIGRRSISREITPEIDLTGPPSDPGISRLHAILITQQDGSWAVIDPGSENGTTVNSTEIPVGQPVPLSSGDSIYIGAWTAITIIAQA